MDETYNFSEHYIKIRKIGGKLVIEVWELYNSILRLQVPFSHYKYNIYKQEFKIVRKYENETK